MNWVSGIVVYTITWWVVLFAVLPWRVTTTHKKRLGEMAGAPDSPHILYKAMWTTIIATVVFVGIYAVVASDLISFQDMADQTGRY
jgi:predicted secreted protein